MGTYIPNTKEQQDVMLNTLGLSDYEELFSSIPEELKFKGKLNIPEKKSELKVTEIMSNMASKNRQFHSIFRGAGSYNHFIPSMVGNVTSKEVFQTTYTPYQAEVSQGVLQNIFEFQTMICELTGMDSANASVYDGATAAAEAISMIVTHKKEKVLVASTAMRSAIETIRTYAFGSGAEIIEVPEKEGVLDHDFIRENMTEDVAGIYVQSPNFYGNIEDVKEISQIVKEKGGMVIMGANPMTLAILETPRNLGADIAVGEAQPLGISMGYGGPYLGYMATTQKNTRKLPGRIVGQTTDTEGKRAFVLTLQAREQHIRRERASSNICSNQALCVLQASVYLATIGPKGLEKVATASLSKAHYLAKELEAIGFEVENKGEFFHEFVTTSDIDTVKIDHHLRENGVLGGLPLDQKRILWCTTEMNSKEQIDNLVSLLKEVK